jgi:nitrite reductase/ring-hydroxylating ferredoxin subunit
VSDSVAVLAASELPPGGRARVEAFGTEVALFNVDGELYALANACPHHGGPLCFGRITGARVADAPYEHRWERESRIVVCPWHGWEFDLETGRSLFDESVGVRIFDVHVEDGAVRVRRRLPNRWT